MSVCTKYYVGGEAEAAVTGYHFNPPNIEDRKLLFLYNTRKQTLNRVVNVLLMAEFAMTLKLKIFLFGSPWCGFFFTSCTILRLSL